MKRFTMVVGFVRYDKNYGFFQVGGIVDGRIRGESKAVVINPDGSIYDADIGGVHCEDMVNGIVEDCFASITVYSNEGANLIKGAVITNYLPQEVDYRALLCNFWVKGLLPEQCRTSYTQYGLRWERRNFLAFNEEPNLEEDIYENPVLILELLKKAIVNTSFLVFMDVDAEITTYENGKVTVADNSVNKIKLMTIDGKQVVPIYTDYEPANEAGKAGFIEPEKVNPIGIGFDAVLRLVEQCDGFVINPYSSNNIAFDKAEAIEMCKQERIIVAYCGEKEAYVEEEDWFNKIGYYKPDGEDGPVIYQATLDVKASKDLYEGILSTVGELRPVLDEMLRVVFDYVHGGKAYFLDISKQEKGYVLEVGRFVRGGNEYSTMRTQHSEKFRIYRHPETFADLDALKPLLKKIVLDNKYPAKVEWEDITVYRKYECYMYKVAKAIVDRGELDQQFILMNYPCAEEALYGLLDDGILEYYSHSDDYDGDYKLVATAEEIRAKYPKAFRPIVVGQRLRILKGKWEENGKKCIVKKIVQRDGQTKYLVEIPALKTEGLFSEEDLLMVYDL